MTNKHWPVLFAMSLLGGFIWRCLRRRTIRSPCSIFPRRDVKGTVLGVSLDQSARDAAVQLDRSPAPRRNLVHGVDSPNLIVALDAAFLQAGDRSSSNSSAA